MNVNKHLITTGAASSLLLAALLLAGCQTQPPSHFAEVPGMPTMPALPAEPAAAPAAAPTSTAPAAPAASAAGSTEAVFSPVVLPGVTTNSAGSSEIFHEGDALIVIFSDLPGNQPSTPFEEHIKDDGTITLLLDQIFKAAGKRRGDLEREIHDRYVPDYYRNLTVTIKPQDRFYFVDGEVRASGRQLYVGRMTVLKAIGSCGDFTDFANKKKVKVIRNDGRIDIVNCVKAREDPRLDLEIFPNDHIIVPRKII
ncbi:MAG: hypothetical protein DME25_09405 [Verrucomicrobia bacterium]|nr:MAG: hypothetical protein DME25_09405 [Verrucomicrobiota bacterium]